MVEGENLNFGTGGGMTGASGPPLSDDVNLGEFVVTKDEFSGADIIAICTESGSLSLREFREKLRLVVGLDQDDVDRMLSVVKAEKVVEQPLPHLVEEIREERRWFVKEDLKVLDSYPISFFEDCRRELDVFSITREPSLYRAAISGMKKLQKAYMFYHKKPFSTYPAKEIRKAYRQTLHQRLEDSGLMDHLVFVRFLDYKKALPYLIVLFDQINGLLVTIESKKQLKKQVGKWHQLNVRGEKQQGYGSDVHDTLRVGCLQADFEEVVCDIAFSYCDEFCFKYGFPPMTAT